jgi:3-methyladenine DNA glycosylase Tag
MKEQKLKSLVKNARKVERKKIKSEIYSNLKAFALKFAPTSKKIEKVIKRDASKLAKIISKDLKIDESSLVATLAEQKDASSEIIKAENASSTAAPSKIATLPRKPVTASIVKATKK